MAFTDVDLIAVRSAMLRGELEVEFADRRVRYRSIAELQQVEQRILTELTSTQTRGRQTYGVAAKGF